MKEIPSGGDEQIIKCPSGPEKASEGQREISGSEPGLPSNGERPGEPAEPEKALEGEGQAADIQRKRLVIEIGGQKREFIVVDNVLFGYDETGRPERYVGRLPPRKRRGFRFH